MPDQYVRIRQSPDLSFHRPQHVYEGRCPVHSTPDAEVVCQVTSNTNESMLWCDDDCRDMHEWTQLRKCWQAMGTMFATVWQDTDQINMTTGRVETDPKKFKQHLADKSKEMEDRLGMPVDYQPCDPSDTYVSDEGLDATHDRQVETGQKDSRGRFVWTV